MDFRDIEYFAVLAEHGHVGRAAEALGLSQPALSLSLRRLEKSVDAKLVKRTPKGVELTEVGTALLSRIVRLRLARDDVVREVADLSQGRAGDLRIGAHPGVIEDLLGPTCSTLIKDTPRVTLTVSVETFDVAVSALRAGKLDLILGLAPAPPHEDLVYEHLLDDIVVVFGSVNHRLARQKQVTMAELSLEGWVVAGYGARGSGWPQVHRAFEESGLPAPRIAVKTTSLALRDYLVASTDLLGASSRRVLRQVTPQLRLKELPVKEFSGTRRMGVAYRKDTYLSPAARRFIAILKATAKKLADATR